MTAPASICTRLGAVLVPMPYCRRRMEKCWNSVTRPAVSCGGGRLRPWIANSPPNWHACDRCFGSTVGTLLRYCGQEQAIWTCQASEAQVSQATILDSAGEFLMLRNDDELAD